MPDIKPGHIVQGPRWPEPVDVKLIEDMGDYVHLVGATTGSGEHVDQLIPRGELAQLQIARVETDFAAPPREVFLGLEARRYRFASLYDPLFVRRAKEDLRSFDGRPLFLPRHVETMPFNLGVGSPREKDLYNALSRYANEQYNRALTHGRRRNVAFALVILQRRLASSTYALYRSLERTRRAASSPRSGWRCATWCR